MEQRPTCPTCGDVLIEGECIQHGVIAGAATVSGPPSEEIPEAPPGQRARVITPEGGGPAYVVFEPESVARERERREAAERPPAEGPTPAGALPVADETLAPRRAPGEDDMVVIDQKPVWIAAVAAVVLLLFALLALWRGQANVAARIERVQAGIDALDDQLSTLESFRIEAEARFTGVEKALGDTINVAQLAKRVKPAVFTIQTAEGVGSGFVVERTKTSSTLLTNLHVVASVGRGGRVGVDQKGRPALTGRVTAVDAANDLAAVVVPRRLPILALHTKVPKAGDPVIAVGSPLGLGGTVSEGIVSGRVQGLVQFSAPASPGSSGGPLVNAKGQVIGIVTLKIVGFGAEGLAFAVPSAAACDRILEC